MLPLGQKAVLHPKPPSHLSHPGSQEWSWKEPGGCLDSSGFSLLLWLAPCCISQSPCSNVSTSWRPQTLMGLNCSQLVTSSASGRLESHKVNSFKFHPLCISFSVSSPTLPSFTLISWQKHPSPLPPSSLLPLVPSHFPSCILLFKRMASSILKIRLLNLVGPQAATPCFSFLLPVSFLEDLVQTPPSLHLALTPESSQSWFQPRAQLKICT